MNKTQFTPAEILDELASRRSPRPEIEESYATPIGESESKIAVIWSEILRIDPVGRLDNFISLGGDSLRMLQVINRIRSSMQVELEFIDFFEDATVAGLAERIRLAREDI